MPPSGPACRPMGPITQALEFARRGFAALVVMRRGYGDSGGDYAENSGPCGRRDYSIAAKASVSDLRAAIDAMKSRTDVTTNGMIAVGASAGGFATRGADSGSAAGPCRRDQLRRRPRLARRRRCLRSRMRWSANSPPSGGRREFRCCGSMRATTNSSGLNSRTGCTRRLPAPAGAPSSSTRPQSATTATSCFPPRSRSGRRWSTASCASRISAPAISMPLPAPAALPPPPQLGENGREGFASLSRRRPAQGVCGVAEGRLRLAQRTPIGARSGRRCAGGMCGICAGLHALCGRRQARRPAVSATLTAVRAVTPAVPASSPRGRRVRPRP